MRYRTKDEEISALLVENERLEALIYKHNSGCDIDCSNKSPGHCDPYTRRGQKCPDCPKDYKIDDVMANEGLDELTRLGQEMGDYGNDHTQEGKGE